MKNEKKVCSENKSFKGMVGTDSLKNKREMKKKTLDIKRRELE
jgi:hypothetical protein